MASTCIIDSKGYRTLIKIIAIMMGIFQIVVAGYGFIVINMRCAIHLTFALTLIAMLKPVRFKSNLLTDVYNIAFTLICLGCGLFLTYETRSAYVLPYTLNGPSQMDVIVGTIILILVLVGTRRTTGNALPIICSVFILYAMFGQYLPGLLTHKAYKWRSIVDVVVFTSEGLYGQPLSIASSYVAAFVLFGSFLSITGAGQWFIDMAFSLTGKYRSGPAMTAVVSSAAMGTISGTGVANVVTTGAFTIPLMKSCGYSPTMAGAVEATASTGGQIMPPIMGAAAFLMAEMVGVQYGEIAMRAIFPALLYFTGIFITVHLEAKRLGLKGIPKDELPKFGPLFLRQGYLLIPLVALVAMVMMGYTMSRAAIIATALAILVSMPNKETRMNPTRFINALEAGGKNTLSVAVACGVAGIIAGVVTMTGLGQLLISAIVGVAGDRVIVALFLTMLTCIVLGMGVPTTANYIIMATTCAPILVNGMGINKIAANMFVFYFGIVADITPPVALAAYAGSAIAKSNPMKTALNASRLAIAAFIVPYIFAFNPAMLFIDTGVLGVVTIIITSLIGLFGVAAGLEGYMFANLNVIERLLSIVGGLCLIIPGTVTDLVGIVLVGISAALQMMKKKKAAVA